MSFFTNKQKQLALENSRAVLQEAYHKSELNLQEASRSGNERWLKTAMAQHGNFEYALLYKNTPEYKSIIKSQYSKKRGF